MGPKMNNVGVRLDDLEYRRLLDLAHHFGLRPTEVIRLLLKKSNDEIFGLSRAGAR